MAQKVLPHLTARDLQVLFSQNLASNLIVQQQVNMNKERPSTKKIFVLAIWCSSHVLQFMVWVM